ncbi:MAG: carbohydrate binding family 9 domain-containing protein [Bacteroidetes bacterium]|nr:carbohydrate binding family 9 domain-containing protein [Bacteroidota bacterium]
MKKLNLILFVFLMAISVYGIAPKQVKAIRIPSSPKIDGVLDEEAWKSAELASDFIQRSPTPGINANKKTEVRIIYDDAAIYIGAMMYDEKPDSILRELTTRDNEANADLFGFVIDTYNDDLNGYGFFVSAANVQIDARYSSGGNQDFNWDAVWFSQTKINEQGWVAEFKIPYAALRFPKVDKQNWGINFLRKVRRTREDSFWNEVNPQVNGFVNQFGDITGIENIKSPLRLSITPYVSAYLENYPYNQTGKSNNSYSFNGGMDIKYGINESFTLDMTLVPDFGQVQSDNRVLNLSPFEVQYNENRQFFTEGTELFNRAELFYSRRIGGEPLNYYKPYSELNENEYVKENPGTSQLLNATKISGRTQKGLGIGFFNATSKPMFATISDSLGNTRKVETSPLTNYNILVFDQSLKNNSYISLINTNVTRNGSDYDANVTGTEFKFANKNNTYAINGNGALSQLFFADSTPVLGYKYFVNLGKISGQWQYGGNISVKSDKYDPNDLGIQFQNNTLETYIYGSYNIFKPVWRITNLRAELGTGYSRLYKPGMLWNYNIWGDVYTNFRNFLSMGGGFNLEPIITYDHWEPRITGRYYEYPKDYMGYYWISTDYRKKFAIDVSVNYKYFEENNRYNFLFNVSPRYRASNRLLFVYNINREYLNDDIGFVNYDATEDVITFGRRNLETITNTLSVDYKFTSLMALTLRARHYWSKADYQQYYTLSDKGKLFDSPLYAGNSNVNFNAFNIDLVYRWRFSPGSEVSIVWKNSIYTFGQEIVRSYAKNADMMFNSPQTNSFSIKLLYYLDYSMIKRRNK